MVFRVGGGGCCQEMLPSRWHVEKIRGTMAWCADCSCGTEAAMSFQYVISPTVSGTQAPPITDTAELLRQLLEVQREQLQLQRQAAAAHDMNSRWRAFIARWQQD